MRLSETEHTVINEAIRKHDQEAAVYLFGSRVDDTACGGDIDLMVLSRKIDIWKRLDILADLHEKLGERRIDLLVYSDFSRPFSRITVSEGVLL